MNLDIKTLKAMNSISDLGYMAIIEICPHYRSGGMFFNFKAIRIEHLGFGNTKRKFTGKHDEIGACFDAYDSPNLNEDNIVDRLDKLRERIIKLNNPK